MNRDCLDFAMTIYCTDSKLIVPISKGLFAVQKHYQIYDSLTKNKGESKTRVEREHIDFER